MLLACSPEREFSETTPVYDPRNDSDNGSGGGTNSTGENRPSGGSSSTTGADYYPVGSDFGLSGEGGASNNGLGQGDLTVLLLIDRSSSMAENWDSGSKWEVSLNAFFLGLIGVEDDVTLGALFFPTDGECDVAPMTAPNQFEYQSGRSFVSSWKAKSSSIFPLGSTPLGPAFEQANIALTEAQNAGLMESDRRFRVVVVTDGVPNCGTDQNRVLQLANIWRTWGVELRIIGLPGSEEASAFLQNLAVGSTPTGNDEVVTPGSGADAEDEFYQVIR